MADLLKVEDLEKAKKHDTFHSEVITGKDGGLSGGTDIDYATNAVTGQVQKTLPKTIDDLDWTPVGTFAAGVTFTKSTDYALDASGNQWIYAGASPFPVVVAPGTVPSSPDYKIIYSSDYGELPNGRVNQLRRGTSAEIAAYVLADGEVIKNDDDGSLHVGDGVTAGGVKHLNVNNSSVVFKQSPGVSAVENMIAGNPFEVRIGDICSTGVTVWKRLTDVSGDISDFTALNNVHCNDFFVSSVTDKSTYIQAAITFAIQDNSDCTASGIFTYDNSAGVFEVDVSTRRNFSIKGKGFAQMNVIGDLDGETWRVKSYSSNNGFDFDDMVVIYTGTSDSASFIKCSRNFVVNEWGGTMSSARSRIQGFTDTQVEIMQGYNCCFDRCIFTGSDEGVYTTGVYSPAVVGADSSCVRLTGGDPSLSGALSFSNLIKFKQCEFQGAKYGVDGYHLRQTDFDSCTFQFLWIGISNVVDDVNGEYSWGDITLSGVNYFEFIANRSITDLPIEDDGTTIGTAVRESKFYGFTEHEFTETETPIGANVIIRTGGWEWTRPNNLVNERDWISIGHEGVEQKEVRVTKDGLMSTRRGYNFENGVKRGDTEFHETLDRVRNLYNTSKNLFTGTSGQPQFSSVENYMVTMGRLSTLHAIGYSYVSGGSGQVVILLPDSVWEYVHKIVSVQIVSNGGATTPSVVYGSQLGGLAGQQIALWADAAKTVPLNYGSGLVLGVGTELAITVQFINKWEL